MARLDKILNNIILIVMIIIFSVFSIPSSIKCQESFLLTSDEMEEYELARQGEGHWLIGDGNQMKNVISQKWHIKGRDTRENVYIYYCEFNTIPEAIIGTSYSSKSHSVFYLWGSFNGSITGDMSWIDYSGNSALYFVRGNIGIMIFKPHHNTDDKQRLDDVSKKILNKIQLNLSSKIIFDETKAKQRQIPMNSYKLITDPLVQSQIMNGFSLLKTWDSKWLYGNDVLTTGIRTEWGNGQNFVIGIDICMFNSHSSALNAAENQGKMTRSAVFNLNDFDSLQSILEEWQNKWRGGFPKQLFSIVGVKDDIAIHVYQYNPDNIDTDFFHNLVEQLSGHIGNF